MVFTQWLQRLRRSALLSRLEFSPRTRAPHRTSAFPAIAGLLQGGRSGIAASCAGALSQWSLVALTGVSAAAAAAVATRQTAASAVPAAADYGQYAVNSNPQLLTWTTSANHYPLGAATATATATTMATATRIAPSTLPHIPAIASNTMAVRTQKRTMASFFAQASSLSSSFFNSGKDNPGRLLCAKDIKRKRWQRRSLFFLLSIGGVYLVYCWYVW